MKRGAACPSTLRVTLRVEPPKASPSASVVLCTTMSRFNGLRFRRNQLSSRRRFTTMRKSLRLSCHLAHACKAARPRKDVALRTCPGDIPDRECRSGKPRKATTVTMRVAFVRHARRQSRERMPLFLAWEGHVPGHARRHGRRCMSLCSMNQGDNHDDGCRLGRLCQATYSFEHVALAHDVRQWSPLCQATLPTMHVALHQLARRQG
jgi:hypothetical protein